MIDNVVAHMRWLRAWWIIGSLLFSVQTLAAIPTYSSKAHDTTIESARTDVTSSAALEQFKHWESQPLKVEDKLRVQSDLVVLLLTAGDTSGALKMAQKATPGKLPDYALDSAFAAARSKPDLKFGRAILDEMLRRHPRDFSPRLREVYWLMDARQLSRADTALKKLEAKQGKDTPRWQRGEILHARLALSEARDDAYAALAASAALLDLYPDDVAARRTRALSLDGEGASPTARWLGERDRDVLSPAERAALAQQAAGHQLRWGRMERDRRTDAQRFQALDAALLDIDLQLATLKTAEAIPANQRERLRQALLFDKVVALTETARYEEATQLHEQLRAEGIDEPAYVLSAAAGSYQKQLKSQHAVPLYEEALRKGGDTMPVPSDAHVGLVYAYVDTGRFQEADALLDRIEAATPETLRRAPVKGLPNPEWGEVQTLRAQTDLYMDRPKTARQRLDRLAGLAPYSPSIRAASAQAALYRGHPENSIERYERTLVDHPDSVDAKAGYSFAMLEAGRLREGTTLSQDLEQRFPESASVRYTARQRDALRAPTLMLHTSFGSGAGTLADEEWRIGARMHSQPLRDRWRGFVEQFYGLGKTNIGNEYRARTGVGVSYTMDRWYAEAQVHNANQGPRNTGVATEVGYRASDTWRLGASADTNTNEAPWKAYLSGVNAARYALQARYIVNESRHFDAYTDMLDYTDGNARNGVGLSWTERWYSAPLWMFETTAGADTSRSDSSVAPYFSPESDFSVSVTGHASYLTWKDDRRMFRQHASLGGGSYHQDGFGSGALWNASYWHDWTFRELFTLEYGLGYAAHPYDGNDEERSYGFLRLRVPFL